MSEISGAVRKIILDVRKRGDRALCDLARRYDQVVLRPRTLAVSPAEIRRAKGLVSASFLKSLKECAKNIEAFARHEKAALLDSWIKSDGSVRVGQIVRPLPQFVQQPRVLHRDNCLRGEIVQQRNLLL